MKVIAYQESHKNIFMVVKYVRSNLDFVSTCHTYQNGDITSFLHKPSIYAMEHEKIRLFYKKALIKEVISLEVP